MAERKFFFWVLVGTAVFIYLIGSFLVASFNITLWKDGQRFFAVIVYLIIVWESIKALAEPKKQSKAEPKEALRLEEKLEVE